MFTSVTLSVALLALLLPGMNGQASFEYNADDYEELSTDDPDDICQTCHPDAVCSSEKTCTCKEGFVGTGHIKCDDVDECRVDPGVCGVGANCSNNPGSFSCICQNGYRPTTGRPDSFHPLLNGTHCDDIDECREDPRICGVGGNCINNPGSFICTCQSGYRLTTGLSESFNPLLNGIFCIDVDECQMNPKICGDGGQCINSPGSFSCSCLTGYQSNITGPGTFPTMEDTIPCIDVDECLVDSGVCGVGGNCSNNPGSFSCICQNGYWPTTGRPDSFNPILNATHCDDVDECQENPKICGDGGQCINSPGSFSCSCLTGYQPNIRGTGPFYTMKDTIPCIDIDECREDPKMCGVGGNCFNNPGSFSCTCQSGYRLTTDLSESFHPFLNGTICIDVDECLVDPGVCGVGGNCSNNPGSFSCICQNGYQPTTGRPDSFHPLLNATHCDDVDECQENPKICGDRGHCVNSPGSFSCSCLTGYQPNMRSPGPFHAMKDIIHCIDVDECLVDPGVCSVGGNCSNNPGSFSCTCQNGYRPTTGRPDSFHPLLNATHCDDVDECQENPKICGDGGQCINSPGSFSCSCLTGYQPNIRGPGPFHTMKDTIQCIDIDECREDPRRCGVGGNCFNNPGKFSCTCQTGYRLSTGLSESYQPLLKGTICIGSTISLLAKREADPVSFRALNIDKNSELTWEVEGGIQDTIYRFQVNLRGERPYDPSFVDNREIKLMSSNQTVHVPLSLLPGTEYTIDVSVTNASASNSTKRLVMVVPIADPPKPNVPFGFLDGMSLPLRLVSDNNGPVSFYQFIVAPLEGCLEFPCANPTLGNFWSALGSGTYIIAELQANNTWDGMPFQIGDRKSYGGYYNAISRYGDHCVVLRVVSIWNNDTKYSCSPNAILKRYNFEILFILQCIPIALFVGGLSLLLGYYTAIKMYKRQKKQEEEVELTYLM